MKSILFVCTGNVCRSPMAEGLFRHATRDRAGWSVASAGLSAATGQPPSPESVRALRELGIEIGAYRSQPLTDPLVDQADYIFVMTRAHLETVCLLFPQAAEKTFLVREFEAGVAVPDVPDPIGQGYATYLACRDVLRGAIDALLRHLTQSDPSMTPPSTPVQPLRIALAADHGGVEIRRALAAHLRSLGYALRDFGTDSTDSVDYPDYAEQVCAELIAGRADFGILVCRTGIGMSIAANRHPEIRAALVDSEDRARITRSHNDANVLCLAADSLDAAKARRIADAFLSGVFEGGRHRRRLDKLPSCPAPRASALATIDPEIAEAILLEERRQREGIELIASENFTSPAVMEAQGSCLTNKYAEGYPGRRWYGGCEHVDAVERLAIDRALRLFGAEHANVQPHSGSQANMAVYFSALQPGDRILTMNLAHGGHLTHGHKANFSGRLYEVLHYGVSNRDECIDYDDLARMAAEFRPKMITAGASAYPRTIDFSRMRAIADSVGALLFVDMAHIAGLVAAGVHPSPVGLADFVTTTTHKSLRGPRGGLILCKEAHAKKIDSQLFPGVQGGPLMHVIAAKAVCLHEALQPEFKAYAEQIVRNAKALAARLAHQGYRIVSGGTDNHLLLVDLRPRGLTGIEAQETLDRAGITVNKNAIPFDTEPITKTGGIRIGTPAATTRGMKEDEMMEIADLIHEALEHRADPEALARVRSAVATLAARFPLP